MLNLILATLVSCPITLMVNKTNKDWNDYDRMHLVRARQRCGEIYKKSPCLIEFRKRTESDYSAICGKGR